MSDFLQRLLSSGPSPASTSEASATSHRGGEGLTPTGQLGSPLVNYDQRLSVDGFFETGEPKGVSPAVDESDSAPDHQPSPFTDPSPPPAFSPAPAPSNVQVNTPSLEIETAYSNSVAPAVVVPAIAASVVPPSSPSIESRVSVSSASELPFDASPDSQASSSPATTDVSRWTQSPSPSAPVIDGSYKVDVDASQEQSVALPMSLDGSPDDHAQFGSQEPFAESTANNSITREPVSPSHATVQPQPSTLSSIERVAAFAPPQQSTEPRPPAGLDGDTPAGTVSPEQAPVAPPPASMSHSLFASFEDAMMSPGESPSPAPASAPSSEALSEQRLATAPAHPRQSEVKHTVRVRDVPPERSSAETESPQDIHAMVNAALGGWLEQQQQQKPAAKPASSDEPRHTAEPSAKPIATPIAASRTTPTPVDRLSAQSAAGTQPPAAPRLVIGQITVDMVAPAGPAPSVAPKMPTTAAAASKIGPISRRVRR